MKTKPNLKLQKVTQRDTFRAFCFVWFLFYWYILIVLRISPLPRKKPVAILHPNLPITGTSRQRLLSSVPKVAVHARCFKLVLCVVRHAEKRCMTSEITNACQGNHGYPSVHLSNHQEPSRRKFQQQTSFVWHTFSRCWKICIDSALERKRLPRFTVFSYRNGNDVFICIPSEVSQ